MKNTLTSKEVTSKRLVAYVIDWYLLSLLTSLPVVYIYSVINDVTTKDNSLHLLPFKEATIAFAIGIVLSLIYLVYIPFKNNGQTLGKRFMGIRTVKLNGDNASFTTLFVRGIIGVVLLEGAVMSTSALIQQYLEMSFGFTFPTYVQWVYIGILILSAIFLLFSSRKQMFHDMISGTTVISCKK